MFIKEFKSWVFTVLILMAAFAFTANDAKAATVNIVPNTYDGAYTCDPFGWNHLASNPADGGPMSVLVYKNIPAFDLNIGDSISFDFRAVVNDTDVQYDIAMAETTVNGGDIATGAGFTKIVSNTVIAAAPRGNAVEGDYELTYTLDAPYSFPGGGLLIRLSNRGGAFATDATCNAGVSTTTSSDTTNFFVGNYVKDTDGLSPYDNAMTNFIPGFVLETSEGKISTIAGTGVAGHNGEGSPATSYQLNYPFTMAFDSADNMYVGDYINNRVRKITPAGAISTIAGNGTGSSTGDGADAASATLSNPTGVALDNAGNIYITEWQGACVRRIDNGTNVITTVVGTCGTSDTIGTHTGIGGDAASALLVNPTTVAFDSNDNMYIADRDGHSVFRVDAVTNIITLFAGDGTASSTGDGGHASASTVNASASIAFDSEGDMYIAEFLGNRIRKVNMITGIISTVAGTGAGTSTGDTGLATSATINVPASVKLDGLDNLYIVEYIGSRIRRVDAVTGIITTVLGDGTNANGGDGGLATAATVINPVDVAFDSAYNWYVTNGGSTIRKVVGPPSFVPLATDGIFYAYEDVVTTGTLKGSDADGDAITYIKLTDPANGSVTITDSTTGVYTYTPDADFNGADSFTFKVNDGSADSTTATVTVTINAVDEIQAQAGEFHTIIIKADGTMWASGDDSNGEQGNGAGGANTEFTQIGSGTDWAVLSVGYFHNLALKTDGTLWAWGRNVDSRLGVVCASPCQAPIKVSTDTDWAFINGGLEHSAAIKSDGSLWTWGNDTVGQLGNGAVGNQSTPTKVSSDVWSNVSAGGLHTLAVKADGSLWAWGLDNYGQLGDGTATPDNHSQTQVGVATNWVSAEAGYQHSLALDNTGKIYSWGRDIEGQLGDGTVGTPDANPNVAQIGSLTNWVSISAGSLNTMAINSSGELYSWGYNPDSQLGHSGTTDTATVTQVGTDTDWASISPNLRHTVGVKNDGTIFTWGSDQYGQLGVVTSETCGGQPCSTTPVIPLPYAPLANDSIFMAYEDVVTTGTLTGSDANGDSITYIIVAQPTAGQGSVSITDSTTGEFTYTPTADFNGATSFTFKTNDGALDSTTATVSVTINAVDEVHAATGEYHTVIIKDDGTLWATGTDSSGQQGNGAGGANTVFTQIGSDTGWAVVKSGDFHNLAIKTDGTLWAWGSNANNQLGVVCANPCQAPIKVSTDTDWAFIDAGERHSTAIKSDGSLWTWGNDVTGQLGNGAGGNQSTPTKVSSDIWSDVSAGGFHSLAIKSDGSLWSWGHDDQGQLGDGVATPNNQSPTQVGVATNWVSATAGFYHSVALNGDGKIYSWGNDQYGQLGDGVINPNNPTVTQVGSLTNWVSIDAFHSNMVINSSGELYSWGLNTYSQLGHSGTTDTPTVTQVGTDTDWAFVSAGLHHSIGVKNDGTVLIWGSDSQGQLGVVTSETCGGQPCSTTPVNALNTTPVTTDVDVLATEDTNFSGSVTAHATDADGDSLTYSVVADNTTNGSLTLSTVDGSFTFNSLTSNYNGSAGSFTYKVNDGTIDSNISTVTLTISAVNDVPVATAQASVAATEDVTYTGTLAGTDTEGATLLYVISTAANAAEGTVTILDGTTGAFEFVPVSNFNGLTTAFEFTAQDAGLVSTPATVTLNFAATNDNPTADDGGLSATEDIVANGTLTGGDLDGDWYTFSIVGQPANGTVNITNTTTGAYTFTQSVANWNGVNTFTFKTNDTQVDSLSNGTITVTVSAANDAPTANAAGLTATEDITKTGTLTGADIDGDTYTFELNGADGGAAKGTVTITNSLTGAYSYAPDLNANGSDSFQFRSVDWPTNAVSAWTTISVTINAVNDNPTANAAGLTATEDITKTGTLTGADLDGDTYTFELNGADGGAAKGTVTITNSLTGAYSYAPDLNANGADSFQFRSVDWPTNAVSAWTTISVTINGTNDNPTASASTLAVDEDITKVGTLTGADLDGDPYTFVLNGADGGAAKGTVTITNSLTGAYSYVPDLNANGGDSFQFYSEDWPTNATSALATITVTITASNDAPVADDGAITADEDVTTAGTLTGSDLDGDSYTFIKVSGPANGTATITDSSTGAYTYTSNLNYNGSDSFTFKVNDGTVDSATNATITVTVNAVNDAPAPTANGIGTIKNFDGITIVSHNDPDVGDSHSFTVTTDGVNGSAVVDSSGNVTYTPDTDFLGVDSFIVTVTDSNLAAGDVTITVTVESTDNNPPYGGSFNAVPGNGSIDMSWSGFVDDLTGVASYDVVFDTSTNVPATCDDGTKIITSYTKGAFKMAANNGTTYNLRLCATDGYGNRSDGIMALGLQPTGPGTTGLSRPGYDTGLAGFDRLDGSSDSSNLETTSGNAVVDVAYTFSTVVTDLSGDKPKSASLFISSDGGATFHEIILECLYGDITKGVNCSTDLVLGPASAYEFYYEVELDDGTILTDNNGGGNFAGPAVELLTGYTMLSIPRDVEFANLDGDQAFGDPLVYRWLSNSIGTTDVVDGGYLQVTSGADPIKAAEGYFVWKNVDGLNDKIPGLAAYDEYKGDIYVIDLVPGWNIIGTPYGKHTRMSNLTIQRNADIAKTWLEAASAGYVASGLYYYEGSDWGSTYGYITADSKKPGKMSPWLSYYLYLGKDDGDYKLMIHNPKRHK